MNVDPVLINLFEENPNNFLPSTPKDLIWSPQNSEHFTKVTTKEDDKEVDDPVAKDTKRKVGRHNYSKSKND